MNFFSKNKPRVKSENLEDGVKLSVKYRKADVLKVYKLELLKKIIGSNLCLIIINTDVMYIEQVRNYRNDLPKLLNKLDILNINYKKITVKKRQNVSVMGISINKNDNKLYEDNIIGLVVGRDNIIDIGFLLNCYNSQYFIGCDEYSVDELLYKFESSFNDEEKLKSEFKYKIFDDNFIKQLSVFCEKEDSGLISNILEKLYSE